ncbi:MAG: Nramp family divalent metal transporter [Bacteroidia bacterium]|nr:Nramp family divalent metal transporter [Methylotenera sp.]
MFTLPRTATAPFCPSEVRGSVDIPIDAPFWQKMLRFAGPGLLISVGYMDPGNWATDIQAGAKYGYALLWMVVISSIAGMLLQTLSLRLGLVAQKDLARACRDHYSRPVSLMLWLMAELAIIACDVAEVLGSALALHLLFGLSLISGIIITAFDMLIVLGLKGHGFRQVEAIILGLIVTIAACFTVELILVGPDLVAMSKGLVPNLDTLRDQQGIFLAIGILGATVMPHNLYLHSSIVQTRHIAKDESSKRDALKLSTIDAIVSLSFALLVNAAILTLAASAFHFSGHHEVTEIQDAYHLLDPIVGGTLASVLFGIALLASGQSSTFTGTIAGQIVMEGFLNIKIPCWQRRLITRSIALVPAIFGIMWLGEAGVGKLLIASQVVLSLQLPFAIWPLIKFTSDRKLMGIFANGLKTKVISLSVFVTISMANLWLLISIFS